MQCIYCLKHKTLSDYTKTEHVIPQSFGVFKNNFTLNKVVCDTCNQFLGNTLEIALARDSLEGLMRYDHQIKSVEEFKTIGNKSRIIIKLPDGEFKGAYAYRQYSPEAKRILLYPLPQVGFLKGPVREFFLLDQIPDKEYLLKNFDMQNPQAILIVGCDPNIADQILINKGITFKNYDQPPPPANENEIIDVFCDVEGTIDQILMRANAKIAFNYLAYFEGPEFVLHKDFDIIRNYILTGEKPPYPLVRLDENAILGDEPIEGKRRTGHIVTIDWAADGVSIFGQVSLMNWMRYSISLARNFSGDRRDIKRGHFFNFPDKSILTLTTNKELAHHMDENKKDQI